jgi:hypothetical protein
MYYSIESEKMKKDFRYIKDEYTTRDAIPRNPFRKATKKREERTGQLCRICFVKRSTNGSCSCTEYYD